MCWGFDCGDGWYGIIDTLCQKIQDYVDEIQKRNFGKRGESLSDMQVEATQVKEKYGTLCFYVNCSDDAVYDMVEEAEKASAHTCERCGEIGRIRGKSWFTTLCDKCYDKNRLDSEE
jgi:hypothetical protein